MFSNCKQQWFQFLQQWIRLMVTMETMIGNNGFDRLQQWIVLGKCIV